ncbi:MAG: LuxR C-terminal-related transcriptional regulator [Alicyclobacillus sp.]|nr:LuxR C-terminal-related transcriptional regulator [Alicyclobacillus sp.]
MCHGSTNSEIAATMYLTEGTVKNYVSSIYQKLGVRHRAEAVHIAQQQELC